MDQFYWADRIHRAGLGPEPIARRSLTISNLSSALTELMKTDHYRATAASLAPTLRARNGVASAISQLEAIKN